MKHVKSIFTVFLSAFVVITGVPWSMTDKVSERSTQIFSEGSVPMEYEDDCVIVCMQPGESQINTVYTPEDFPELNVAYVEDLTYTTNEELINDEEYQSTFTQILKLYLNENSVNACSVEDASEALVSSNKKNNVPIASVTPNYIAEFTTDAVEPNDTFYETCQKTVADVIGLPLAWRLKTGSETVKVAVLDGYVKEHPDLIGNLGTGYDAYNNTTDTSSGGDSHGTSVAGVLGAVGNNNLGIAGVCWNVQIIPIRFFSRDVSSLMGDSYSYEVDSASFVKAITYLNNNKIFIANMSMGTTTYDAVYESAISNYYGLFVVAAGNESSQLGTSYQLYPACCNCDNIITVAGTNTTGDAETFWQFSNYGDEYVDIAAPAVDIFTLNYDEREEVYGYTFASGTSVAAPLVAGTAALIKSIHNDLSAAEIKSIILSNVDTLACLEGKCSTSGRLNANKAVFGALSYVREDTPSFSGDVNGDGYDDIIQYRNSEGKRQFMTFVSGNVAYSAYPIYTNTTDTYNTDDVPLVGDFNGDGKSDILIHTVNAEGYREVSMYRGNGDGGFDSAIVTSSYLLYGDSSDSDELLVADISGDGNDDLVISYYDDNGKLNFTVMYGKNNGSMTCGSDVVTTTSKPSSTAKVYMLAGDVNGDGYDDIIRYLSYESSAAHFICTFNGGNSPLANKKESIVNFGNTTNTFVPQICDLNDDDYDDILVYSKNTEGCLTLTSIVADDQSAYGKNQNLLTNFDYSDIIKVYTLDCNGDGCDDVVLQSASSASDNYVLYTYLSQSDGISETYTSFVTRVPIASCKFTVGKYFDGGRESFVAEWTETSGEFAFFEKIQHQYAKADGTFYAFPIIQTGIAYYNYNA